MNIFNGHNCDLPKNKSISEVVLGVLVVVLIFILFGFWGNRANIAMTSRSLFVWIGRQWIAGGGDFSHGWIMPIISIGVVWMKRHTLISARSKHSYVGLLALLFSLTLHWAALRAQQPRISLVAFVGVIWAIPFFLYGWNVARQLIFPSAYLLLCFTSYLLVSFTLSLRLTSCAVSCGLLNGLGIASVRNGTAIYSAAAGGFNFDVADPCSGLRSLVVMTALAAPYAYFTQKNHLKRWILFVMSIPLAMMANITRIVTIALVAEFFGQELALSLYHDYSGFLVFAIAALLMVSVGTLLNKIKRGEELE